MDSIEWARGDIRLDCTADLRCRRVLGVVRRAPFVPRLEQAWRESLTKTEKALVFFGIGNLEGGMCMLLEGNPIRLVFLIMSAVFLGQVIRIALGKR